MRSKRNTVLARIGRSVWPMRQARATGRRRRRDARPLAVQQLEPKIALAADAGVISLTPSLVADINRIGRGSFPQDFRVAGGLAYFTAYDESSLGSDSVRGLWSTDGTAAGTTRLTSPDTRVGRWMGSTLLTIGSTTFFDVSGENGTALWKTNGTVASTERVSPESLSLGDGWSPTECVAAGSTLFFVAEDEETGRALWRTDGTSTGTIRVVDINPGPQWSDPSWLTAVGSTIYFTASDGDGTALWKSDGTLEGTTVVTNVDAYNLVAVGSSLFFFQNVDLGNGQGSTTELWKSNGTPEGTALVKDLGDSSWGFGDLTPMGSSTLFFVFDGGETGQELWKSDGTSEGTVLVKDIRPGTWYDDYSGERPESSSPLGLTVVGSTLFFAADDGLTGRELWKSDGSAEGTVLVADLAEGTITYGADEVPRGSNPNGLTAVGDQLFFFADKKLWKTNATGSAPTLVSDLAGDENTGSGSYGALAVLGGSLLFAATDDDHGTELWSTDLATGATGLLKDVNPRTDGAFGVNSFGGSASYAAGAIFKGMLYFAADDGERGLELWRTDGTAAGTVLVKDIAEGMSPGYQGSYGYYASSGPASSHPSNFTIAGDTLFFTANNPATGTELWKTDGTPNGTSVVVAAPAMVSVRVKNFTADPVSVAVGPSDPTAFRTLYPEQVTAFQVPRGFFEVNDGVETLRFPTGTATTLYVGVTDYGIELTNTQFVDENAPPPSDGPSTPSHLTVVGSTLYFVGLDQAGSYRVWKTDGSVTESVPELGSVYVGSMHLAGPMTSLGSSLYFRGIDEESGIAGLFQFDTATGVVSDTSFGLSSSNPQAITVGIDTVFTSVFGTVREASDGTDFLPGEDPQLAGDLGAYGFYALTNPAAGVNGGLDLLRTFTSMGMSASYGATAVLNGMLYFAADDGETGMELWRTDGTAQGTTLVADLHTGDDEYSYSIGSFPHSLFVMGDTLYFMATDAEGTSLWATDGSANNTAKVSVANGVSVRSLMGVSGSTLFSVADNGTTGAEVWRLSQNAAPTGVTLTPASASVAENTSTVARIKVADIAIADDAQGTNSISLVGADAASFEVSGAALYLKAGVALNFETKQTYAVTVSVADATVAGSAAVTAGFTLTVTDVPEAAVISLPTPFANTVTEDAGVDASGFLVTSGTFGIVDPDAGQAAFKTTVGVPAGLTNLGLLTINSGGVFSYRVLNSLDAVQALRAGQTRSEVFTIESLDGTKLDVTFSISGVADVLRGVVADGYLAGATIFADVNRNRTFDAGELFTTTDASGNFSFDFGSLTATLVSVGGTDVSTGLPFAGSLTAPAGSTVINPLTTVVTAVIEASLGSAPPADAAALASVVATATSKVAAGLGLSTTVNLTTFDPLAPTADQTVALAVQKVAAAIANVMVVANTVGADAGAVVRNLASAVTAAPDGATVNLADTSVLTQVLTAPKASGGAPSAPPAAAVVALTQSNSQISSAGNLGAIAQLQTSVQSAGGFVDENAVVSTIVYQAKAPAGMSGPVFSLKEVAGDDRSFLSIDAGTGAVRLLSAADYEAKGAYRFTVVASQQGQATVETVVSIRVNDLNEAPTGLAVSVTSVAENQAAGTVIGALSASDPDAGDTLTFALVAGDGSGDNGVFTIDGNQLKAASTFNFEVRNSYSVRIRVSDAKGLVTEVPVTISVADVADEPLVVERVTAPAPAIFSAGQRVQFAVTLSEIVQVRGKPQIQVRAGGATRTATYVSGSGSATLTFQYVVANADAADVVSIGQKFVFAKKSAIVAGTEKLAAALPAGIAGLVADGVRIDAVPGSVIGKLRVPGGGTYRIGDSLDFIVRFSEAVIVSGVPQIGLTGLTGPRQATYVSGTGSTELTFRYVVRSGDAIRGKKGLGLAKAISLPGGASIGDEAGNRAVLKVSTPSLKAIRFDAVASVTEAAAPNKRSRAVAFAMLG